MYASRDRIKVLIIAGGGVFGQIPIQLLGSLSSHDALNDEVDAFGGTSVGSELCLAIADGQKTIDVFNTFRKDAPVIFKKSWLPHLCGPQFNDKELNAALQRLLPGKYKELEKPVIVPTFDFESWAVKVYDNIDYRDDQDVMAWEVARASSSAPYYLPVFNWFLDGGLIENIPVITTLTALADKAEADFERMDVLALGTGWEKMPKLNLKRINKWWTGLTWLPYLLKMLTRANEMASVFWAKTLVDKGVIGSFKYYNPVEIDGSWDMTDASVLPEVEERTDKFVPQFEEVFNNWLEIK